MSQTNPKLTQIWYRRRLFTDPFQLHCILFKRMLKISSKNSIFKCLWNENWILCFVNITWCKCVYLGEIRNYPWQWNYFNTQFSWNQTCEGVRRINYDLSLSIRERVTNMNNYDTHLTYECWNQVCCDFFEELCKMYYFCVYWKDDHVVSLPYLPFDLLRWDGLLVVFVCMTICGGWNRRRLASARAGGASGGSWQKEEKKTCLILWPPTFLYTNKN